MKNFAAGAFVATCVAIVVFVILRVALYQGPETVLIQPDSTSKPDEVLALRALLEESHRTNDKILTILFGTLGLVSLVAAGLIGFNIYQFRWSEPENRRMATEAIRTELLAFFSDQLALQQKRQDSHFKQAVDKIAQRLNKERQENTRWQRKTSAEVKRQTESAQKFSHAYMDLSRDIVESRFQTLDKNLKRMQHEMLTDSIREAMLKGDFISTYQTSRLVELSLDLAFDPTGLDFQVTRALELLRKSLPFAMSIDDNDVNRLRILLDNLPAQYSGSRETILPLLVPRDLTFTRVSDPSDPFEVPIRASPKDDKEETSDLRAE